jgi:hypothetical protein
LMGHAAGFAGLVEGLGPERPRDGLADPLDEGLAQEGGAGATPVDPGLVAAAFGDGSDTVSAALPPWTRASSTRMRAVTRLGCPTTNRCSRHCDRTCLRCMLNLTSLRFRNSQVARFLHARRSLSSAFLDRFAPICGDT